MKLCSRLVVFSVPLERECPKFLDLPTQRLDLLPELCVFTLESRNLLLEHRVLARQHLDALFEHRVLLLKFVGRLC